MNEMRSIYSTRYGECESSIENKVMEIVPIGPISIRNFLGLNGEFCDC